METPKDITNPERKLSLEAILVNPESEGQELEVPVPPSPTTAAAAPSGWLNWLASPLAFLSSNNPAPVSEEQRQQQIEEPDALEASVLNAQEGNNDGFIPEPPIEVHLLPLTIIMQQPAEQEATKILGEQQLQQEQKLKTEQEATMAAEPSMWNLYGFLGSPTPAAPSGPTNASNVPSEEEVNYVFRPSANPIDPHPAAAFAMQTGAEEARAIQHATNQSTNEASPADTEPAEAEETETIRPEERIRMEAEALEAAQRLAHEEQARIEREEKARQDVLRAAAEEQARIRREEQARIERSRQNAILLQQQQQQQQQQQMLLQRQLEEQQRQQAEIAHRQAMIEHRKQQALEVARIGF